LPYRSNAHDLGLRNLRLRWPIGPMQTTPSVEDEIEA